MNIFEHGGKSYRVDADGFLSDFNAWDPNFAEGMASHVEISPPLTSEHWEIIKFIRESFITTGECPLVYQICRKFKLRVKGLQNLFPSGYLRGACKLSGITYKEAFHGHTVLPKHVSNVKDDAITKLNKQIEDLGLYVDKTYTIDARGFLVNPGEWDIQFAVLKAREMKISGGLTEKHWDIIYYLRSVYEKNIRIPTIYETCEANKIELEELEKLFPDGYHRGAVKIAGLRVR